MCVCVTIIRVEEFVYLRRSWKDSGEIGGRGRNDINMILEYKILKKLN